jgi:hypothetical protein
MGTWSAPICTACYDIDGNPVDASTVVSDVTDYWTDPPKWMDKLMNHNMLQKQNSTFDEAVMSTCDTAKIWGYFTQQEEDAWLNYFTFLEGQNPHVALYQAHFWCSDEGIPYYIQWSAQTRRVEVYLGRNGHVLYSKIQTEENEIEFDEDKYKEYLSNARELFSSGFIKHNFEFERLML